MSGVDPTDALLKMAEALRLSGADLARLADRVADDTPVPTVADLAALVGRWRLDPSKLRS